MRLDHPISPSRGSLLLPLTCRRASLSRGPSVTTRSTMLASRAQCKLTSCPLAACWCAGLLPSMRASHRGQLPQPRVTGSAHVAHTRQFDGKQATAPQLGQPFQSTFTGVAHPTHTRQVRSACVPHRSHFPADSTAPQRWHTPPLKLAEVLSPRAAYSACCAASRWSSKALAACSPCAASPLHLSAKAPRASEKAPPTPGSPARGPSCTSTTGPHSDAAPFASRPS